MIDETIIGPIEIAELRYLEKLAMGVPTNSEMVEVGTFLGRSAYVLAATRPDCSLTVIDPFDANVAAWLQGGTMRGDLSRYTGGGQLNAFRKFTRTLNNVRVCIGTSPLPTDWDWLYAPAALVFIDAAHNYDAITADLAYWSQHVTSLSALCGHDYCDEFSDVRQAVNEFAAASNMRVRVEPGTTIWKLGNAPA